MPNGKDYVLFYLKLLVESISHEGNLRFSETIPYDEQMLSTITNTNIDIVRSAVKIFTELKLMECYEDGTIFMGEVQKMIGSETEWAEKKRNYRASQKLLEQGQKKTLSDKSKRQSKSKETDTDKEQVNEFFNEIWSLYPNKVGKGRISDTKKKELYKHKDQLIKALERYKQYVEANDWLHYQNGSTWFNSGYIDYLDDNYTELQDTDTLKSTLQTAVNLDATYDLHKQRCPDSTITREQFYRFKKEGKI